MSAKPKNAAKPAKTETPTALNIFADKLPETASRRNTPTIVLHDSIPVGKTVSGKIIAILDSPVATIKGKLLHLEHSSGQQFAFPCTGKVRTAIVPGKKDKEAESALQGEVGKMFFATRLPDQANAKKKICLFDVYTSDK